jgi:hypothetical protein
VCLFFSCGNRPVTLSGSVVSGRVQQLDCCRVFHVIRGGGVVGECPGESVFSEIEADVAFLFDTPYPNFLLL